MMTTDLMTTDVSTHTHNNSVSKWHLIKKLMYILSRRGLLDYAILWSGLYNLSEVGYFSPGSRIRPWPSRGPRVESAVAGDPVGGRVSLQHVWYAVQTEIHDPSRVAGYATRHNPWSRNQPAADSVTMGQITRPPTGS